MSSEGEGKQVEDQQQQEIGEKKDDKLFPKPAIPAKTERDVEREQESKLRAKYPGLKGPGSSAFLQKRLSKGQKFFDSGDYNMAKAKMGGVNKPLPPNQKLLLPASTGDAIPTPETVPQRKTSLAQPCQHHSTFTHTAPLS